MNWSWSWEGTRRKGWIEGRETGTEGSKEGRKVVCSYMAGCLYICSSWCFPSELRPQSSNSDLSLTPASVNAPSVTYKNKQLIVCSRSDQMELFLSFLGAATVWDITVVHVAVDKAWLSKDVILAMLLTWKEENYEFSMMTVTSVLSV